ncbi:hypothetical protein EHW65_20785 [Erwinia psidii]|uniref:hypothetical protein n=1 Tax=Erwinia psidii TaxID=69224 RepID=UPI00226B1FF1|nr:hypothetical protein [Erwinia psidii]MCX8959581.1 hypothetical protein [Erwinia psidii]
MKNYIKNPVLLHDGFENDFIHKKNIFTCPRCEGELIFSVFGSKGFNSESVEFKEIYSRAIKGVKKKNNNSDFYHYKGEAISFFKSKCDPHCHEFTIFFTFSEAQPARYISHLLGVFCGCEKINSSVSK